jgi:endonuclease/exonuclease/phosphatase family metal-dependent hydrolase
MSVQERVGPVAAGPDVGGPEPGAPGRPWAGSRVRRSVAWSLVVPAALWLAVRATGVGAGTPVETVVVFTPYVGLASLAVVVAAALLRVRGALAAAVGCCAGYAAVLAPQAVPGPDPSPAPDGPELRVMTANVQYGWADPEEVVRLVRERRVDLLGVQELTPEFHRALLDAGVADLLPHMVIDARPGPDGTGLYSRHPVEAVDVEVEGRSAHPTGLVDVPGAPPVQVTVVHPVPPVGRDLGSWRRTLQTLPRPADDGRVHLLVGDFNATVDQPTMRDLLADGYVDAAAARGRGWVPTWSRGLGPGLAIDHVLVDRATAVRGVSVHGLPGSDHRAVVAELRLPAG